MGIGHSFDQSIKQSLFIIILQFIIRYIGWETIVYHWIHIGLGNYSLLLYICRAVKLQFIIVYIQGWETIVYHWIQIGLGNYSLSLDIYRAGKLYLSLDKFIWLGNYSLSLDKYRAVTVQFIIGYILAGKLQFIIGYIQGCDTIVYHWIYIGLGNVS